MKEDLFRDFDYDDIAAPMTFDRREFLKLLGGGIVILFTTVDVFALPQERRRRRFNYPEDFNAYLRIGEDGRVTCFTGKIEMGQGVVTSLAQELAEELAVPIDMIDMVMGDTDLCPWDMGTFGSLTTRYFGPALRAAGAEAREVLLQLAAEALKVPKARLAAKDGFVVDKANRNKRISYAALAKGKKMARHLKKKPAAKAVDFRVIGKPENRRDAREKVTGQAKFAADMLFPDMLYARIVRPPAHGATLKSVDTAEAERIAGVQVVRDGDLVAVLHKYPDVAGQALAKVRARFDRPAVTVDDKTIFEHLMKVAPEGEAAARGGSLETGKRLARTTCDETYLNAYVAHAPMEPHAATAKMENGRMIVWASTQTPFRAKEEIARSLGLPSDRVRIITPFVGGGFGGKSANRQAVEAARLAKLTGRPVQVAWTRAEEFFYDTFRPAAIVKIKSGLTDAGKIAYWDYHVYFAGRRGAEQFYDIPHHATIVHGSGWRGAEGTHPFATGPWRAPANNTNSFARESHIDIMAAKAGVDPLEFRLLHLQDKKMRRVLEAAAKAFGWSSAKGPSGRGVGVACGMDAGTYVALMAEVTADKNTGRVQVKRIVAAQDMGLVINPEGAKIQMEGCVTMGMGYALSEEIHFKGGEILDLNFDTYELPRFSWLPQIETVLVDSDDPAPQGGGEPAIICMGAVLANAIYDAIGARMFYLPMTPERIVAATT